MSNALQVLDHVHRMLATVRTVAEAKELRDQATAIQHYAKVSRRSLATQNAAARTKFLCERRAGELLLQVPKVQGKHDDSKGLLATITKSGLSTQTAYRWMNLARMPEAELLRAAALCDSQGEELTSALVYELLVRQWKERHCTPTATLRLAVPQTDALSFEFAKRDLLEWEILCPEDLTGLSWEAQLAVVTQTRAFYEDCCEDVRRAKVATEGGWNPPITMDPQGLGTLARKVICALRAGAIEPAVVRDRLRCHGLFDGETTARSRRPNSGRGLPPGGRYRVLSPFEQYGRLAERFISETLALTQPHGLVAEYVKFGEHQRGAVMRLGNRVRAALNVLEAEITSMQGQATVEA